MANDAELGRLLRRLPQLLEVPDDCGRCADSVTLSYCPVSLWQVFRWDCGGDIFCDEGAFATGTTAQGALKHAIEEMEKEASWLREDEPTTGPDGCDMYKKRVEDAMCDAT